MQKVGDFLNHLAIHAPGQSLVKTTIQNFLMHNFSKEDLFSARVVQNLLNECLEYPHWLQNKNQLEGELKALLDQGTSGEERLWKTEDILWPSELQIVTIEPFKTWIDSVNSYLNFVHQKGEKFRLIHDSVSQKIIGIILHPQGTISVQQFDRKFAIRYGALEPLRDDLILHFDSHLNLVEGVLQKIEVSTYMTAQFKLTENRAVGALIRGYIFQKFHELRLEELTSYPKLFYTIKRMEQFFIKRECDPFYHSLVTALEEVLSKIKWGESDVLSECPNLVARAQNALDYVFLGDKLLTLLLRDLQHSLNSTQQLVDLSSHAHSSLPALEQVPWSIAKDKPLNGALDSRSTKMPAQIGEKPGKPEKPSPKVEKKLHAQQRAIPTISPIKSLQYKLAKHLILDPKNHKPGSDLTN